MGGEILTVLVINFEQFISFSLRYYNIMGKETLKVLSMITSKVVDIFVHPMMLERISTMLNYFLFKLCGPSRKDLKVADSERVDFDPAELVAIISKIYINLQSVDEFCKKVCVRVVPASVACALFFLFVCLPVCLSLSHNLLLLLLLLLIFYSSLDSFYQMFSHFVFRSLKTSGHSGPNSLIVFTKSSPVPAEVPFYRTWKLSPLS